MVLLFLWLLTDTVKTHMCTFSRKSWCPRVGMSPPSFLTHVIECRARPLKRVVRTCDVRPPSKRTRILLHHILELWSSEGHDYIHVCEEHCCLFKNYSFFFTTKFVVELLIVAKHAHSKIRFIWFSITALRDGTPRTLVTICTDFNHIKSLQTIDARFYNVKPFQHIFPAGCRGND